MKLSGTEKLIKPKLPAGKSFLVWLSHDVDRVYKTLAHAFYYFIKNRKWHHLGHYFQGFNTYWNFEKIISLEAKHGVKSTFFFLNESMQAKWTDFKSFVLAKGRYDIRDPKIVKTIKLLDARGWEIGIHGSYRSYNDRQLLKKEKEILEEILGHPIESIRQHYLNLTIPETWQIQKALGLKFDGSFGMKAEVGYREDLFYPFSPVGDDFYVFPVTIMDKNLFNQFKDEKEMWQRCLELINTAEQNQGLLSLLWHQRVFNGDDFPGYATVYERLIIECQNRKAQFCTGRDVIKYLK